MNKKGFINDWIFYMVMILLFSIIIVILYMTLSKANDGWQSSATIPTESKTIMSNWTSRFRSTFDWFIATIFIGIAIALIITAYLVRGNPIYVAIMFIVFPIIIMFGYRFANIFYNFSSSTGIQTYSSQFSVLTVIMNKLPILLIFLFAAFIIILFSKGRGDAFA